MSKLIITVTQETETAKKALKGWQFMIYKRTLNALMGIICLPLRNWQAESDAEKSVFIEEGSEAEIKERLNKLERFLFSDYSELKRDKYHKFHRHIHNRWIYKVGKLKHKAKGAAVKGALGGFNVLTFFSRVGIMIKWEVKEGA